MQNYYEVPEFSASDMRRIARRSLNGKWSLALIPMLIIMAIVIIPELLQYGWLMSDSGIDWTNSESVAAYLQSGGQSGGVSVMSNILGAVSFVITGSLSVSMCLLSIKILRNEEFSPAIAFSGFKKFFQSFFVYVQIWIFSMLWALITVLPGIIVFGVAAAAGGAGFVMIGTIVLIAAIIGYVFLILRYAMAFFIAADNRDLPATQSVAYSVTLMKGRAGKYFLLQLSFIGWTILAVIPLTVGMIFCVFGQQNSSMAQMISGVGLMAVGLVTTSLVQVYINTTDAVFYSAVSGNFGISRTEPQPGQPGGAGDAEAMPDDGNGGIGDAGALTDNGYAGAGSAEAMPDDVNGGTGDAGAVAGAGSRGAGDAGALSDDGNGGAGEAAANEAQSEPAVEEAGTAPEAETESAGNDAGTADSEISEDAAGQQGAEGQDDPAHAAEEGKNGDGTGGRDGVR
ncbi:MAG: DUF975 family protein [Anaerovoracaceae bacterium]|jgi:uncharacterized membrane protein